MLRLIREPRRHAIVIALLFGLGCAGGPAANETADASSGWANPCAQTSANSANANPCGSRVQNPCSARHANPCSANPCASKEKTPEEIRQTNPCDASSHKESTRSTSLETRRMSDSY